MIGFYFGRYNPFDFDLYKFLILQITKCKYSHLKIHPLFSGKYFSCNFLYLRETLSIHEPFYSNKALQWRT